MKKTEFVELIAPEPLQPWQRFILEQIAKIERGEIKRLVIRSR